MKVLTRAVLGLVTLALPLSLSAADTKPATKPATAAAPATAAVPAKAEARKAAADDKTAGKRRGQVPPYYAKVVNDAQREKIYSIQAEHNAKIEQAQAQVKALTEARDAAIEGVLTPEQREQVAKAKAEAEKAQAEKRASAKK